MRNDSLGQEASIPWSAKLRPLAVGLLPSAPPETFRPPRPGTLVPDGYYYHTLSFFCKVEEDMTRRARFPIKFRLGEVHYVERLEGKKGYSPQGMQ